MRLVAVSIVKNEADIIESFVRHTLAWVDHHLVFDHDSTDGTREILGALQREGLPLTLFTDDAPGHLQQARSNHLTRLAASAHGADWILPLDADEILTGPDRVALAQCLAKAGDDLPVSLPLLNYYPAAGDDSSLLNPVQRLRHCQAQPSVTRKIFIPRPLALDPTLAAGKGSHALYRGPEVLPDRRLPAEYQLAHLALRSPQHQVLRVIRAELQRLSRGRAAAGLDVHYRLGYQLLAENPELFLATVCGPAGALRFQPIDYRGGPLRYGESAQDQPSPGLWLSGWSRVARALLPYLEHLATSHGRLADATGLDVAAPTGTGSNIREFTAGNLAPSTAGQSPVFSGFTAREGWGPLEGPVPEAFLPPFHWGYAPATVLTIPSAQGQPARLVAEILTYSENQTVTLEMNGTPVHQHAFGRVNQKETISLLLTLRRGDNELVFRYGTGLRAAHDPRSLAVIFLSLQLLPS